MAEENQAGRNLRIDTRESGVIKMELSAVQKLARVLRVVVVVLIVCGIVAMLLLPGVIWFGYDSLTGNWDNGMTGAWENFVQFWYHEPDGAIASILYAPILIWEELYTAALTLFLWACGICAAVILWQAKRVLDTVLAGHPFSLTNAANMMRASVCCFGISAAALIRLIWSMAYYKSAMPLVSYNTLFIPVFLVAGLVCIVMSALFRQAAEMKAENDLTI